jgi:predicted NBD/HSP70 family sugar kinase
MPQPHAPRRPGQPARQPARQPSLREHNLALVLGQVADAGRASRARIAASTGLTKASVSSLVETLLEAHLVAEVGRDAARVGRPGAALALAPDGALGVGLEVNVDYVAAAVVDLAGTVRARESVVGDLRGVPVPAVLDRAAGVLRRALEGARTGGEGTTRVAGVAVAVPGLVETGGGEVLVAPNLGWHGVPLLAELRARAGLPAGLDLTLGNEANQAALAELWRGGHLAGPGRPLDTFVHVSGEVGVGAGIVLHGELHRGHHGSAGELDYARSGLSDEIDPCAAALSAYAREVGASDDPRTLFAAARSGDTLAVRVVEEEARRIALHIAPLAAVTDVGLIVLGGGIGTNGGDVLYDRIRAQLARWLPHPPRVEVSSLGDAAVLTGAVAVGLRSARENVFVNRRARG